ncbi:DUF262 domain-containing protein [Rhodococcus hoagii]|nr:DUF262 domain-containing protein [Prescottella equi]
MGDLDGHFVVPDYQRGYRWGPVEVARLLDDVKASGDAPYFLQPVVVKRLQCEKWELIDGQQRLTTLFLILQYIQLNALPAAHPRYSLEYETRPSSQAYLSDLRAEDREKNIDFFHIFQAYECIGEWFERQPNMIQAAIDFYTATSKSLQVIWYEAPEHMDSKELFRRLNVGRIPLTDAELVKALLLARFREKNGTQERAHQVAAQWDIVERDLRNPDLWAFATIRSPNEPTYINLLLDTLADSIKKPLPGPRPPFHTFETLRPAIEDSPEQVWEAIQDLHSLLLGWYENRNFYHWIGYLIAVGDQFASMVSLASGLTKTEFAAALEERIRTRLSLSAEQVKDLTYLSKEKCTEVLLLMNVESVRRRPASSERYSFRAYASAAWSLEHIHAQNAESLRTAQQWTEWLRLHRDAFGSLPSNDQTERESILNDIQAALDASVLTEVRFRSLEQRVVRAFSVGESDAEDVHSISNLALLSSADNSALSNSAFEVKRREIIRRDKAGSYVPACTRDVFLKYYTETDAQQIHFWGRQDREGYLNAMLEIVDRFLRKSDAS